MRASLQMFAQMDVAGKRVAVLGDMGELGDFARKAHVETGTLAAALEPAMLLCVGSLARGIAQGACDAGLSESSIVCVPDAQAALDALSGTLSAGDAVLVKASHSMHLDTVVEGLTSSC